MILDVKPSCILKGVVRLPASKSYSIRAFIIAACGGTSKIRHPSDCDDARVAMRIARQLGAEIKQLQSHLWHVRAKAYSPQISSIDVQESGTVLRFVLPLASLYNSPVVIDGIGTLRGRPNRFLTQTLRKMGVDVHGSGQKESIPIRIRGGILRPGEIGINGGLSSQFISALLIACPQLRDSSHLVITGEKIVSYDYITMTLQLLAKSGVKIKKRGPREYWIEGNQTFRGLKNFAVPSDYGLAAFLMAAAVLNKSRVTLKGIFNDDFVQADGYILSFLKKMGVRFLKTKQTIRVDGPAALRGGHYSLKDCPDLVPIMAVLALFCQGKTRLYDIVHARSKESDRISDLSRELRKMGACIQEKNDEMVIVPQSSYRLNCLLDPHHDHRLAMAFAVLGTRVGARIKDIECTTKSYPGFVEDFTSLGVSACLSKA